MNFSTPIGYQNPVWAKTGRELRELADAFNKTMERKKVRQRAQQVGSPPFEFLLNIKMMHSLIHCVTAFIAQFAKLTFLERICRDGCEEKLMF